VSNVDPVNKWLDKAVAAEAQMTGQDGFEGKATAKHLANLYFRQAMKADLTTFDATGHEYKENVI